MKQITGNSNSQGEYILDQDCLISTDDKFYVRIENNDLAPLFSALGCFRKRFEDLRVQLSVPGDTGNLPLGSLFFEQCEGEETSYLEYKTPTIYIPSIPKDDGLYTSIMSIMSVEPDNLGSTDYAPKVACFNLEILNTPNWAPYIDGDTALIFLNEEERSKYEFLNDPTEEDKRITEACPMLHHAGRFAMFCFGSGYDSLSKMVGRKRNGLEQIGSYKKAAIILPSIHSENKEAIESVSEELRNKYGIEYVQVCAKECHLMCPQDLVYDVTIENGELKKACINKIIISNATGNFTIQNTERMQVIDWKELFNQI